MKNIKRDIAELNLYLNFSAKDILDYENGYFVEKKISDLTGDTADIVSDVKPMDEDIDFRWDLDNVYFKNGEIYFKKEYGKSYIENAGDTPYQEIHFEVEDEEMCLVGEVIS